MNLFIYWFNNSNSFFRAVSKMSKHVPRCGTYKEITARRKKAKPSKTSKKEDFKDVQLLPGGKMLIEKMEKFMEPKVKLRTLRQYSNKVKKQIVPFWEAYHGDGDEEMSFLADALLFPLETGTRLPALDTYLLEEESTPGGKKVAIQAYKVLTRLLQQEGRSRLVVYILLVVNLDLN